MCEIIKKSESCEATPWKNVYNKNNAIICTYNINNNKDNINNNNNNINYNKIKINN